MLYYTHTHTQKVKSTTKFSEMYGSPFINVNNLECSCFDIETAETHIDPFQTQIIVKVAYVHF